MKIAVAIPCYNCELQIPRVLEELSLIACDDEAIRAIYVIDNRSEDQTIAAARNSIAGFPPALIAKFGVFRNRENAGLGGTHKIAFTLARQDAMTHLLILHGDHQATAKDIPILLSESRQNGGLCVLGSRFSDLKNLSGYSPLRTWGNRTLNAVYSVCTLKKITDLGSGLNLFRLKDFESGSYQKFDNGFTFNMDMLLYIVRQRVDFRYVPIRWSTTDQISNARALQVGRKTLFKLIPWLLRREPCNPPHSNTEKIA